MLLSRNTLGRAALLQLQESTIVARLGSLSGLLYECVGVWFRARVQLSTVLVLLPSQYIGPSIVWIAPAVSSRHADCSQYEIFAIICLAVVTALLIFKGLMWLG